MMGFYFYIYSMEKFISVCSNPWCKAHFEYVKDDILTIDGVEQSPRICPKCKSFDSELSGGVTWNTKEYEGDRFDGESHQIKYRITNFRL